MKSICFLVVALALLCITAQAQKRTFLRMYSLAGNKFQKGYLISTTDSSLFIYKNKDTIEIPAINIGFIRTKRSLGHNILIGALKGAISGSIIGIATNNGSPGDWLYLTPAEAAFGGFILGGIVGTPAGVLAGAFTKRTRFTINGSLEEWQLQKKRIDLLPAAK